MKAPWKRMGWLLLTSRKSPRPRSLCAPVPATPEATLASSGEATEPTMRSGKLDLTREPITAVVGFWVQATR